MRTSKTLSICPRCAYSEYQELRADGWAEYRGGFLAGFATMAAFAGAIVMALFGVFG